MNYIYEIQFKLEHISVGKFCFGLHPNPKTFTISFIVIDYASADDDPRLLNDPFLNTDQLK